MEKKEDRLVSLGELPLLKSFSSQWCVSRDMDDELT